MPRPELANILSLLEKQIPAQKITLGFDGFVDTIARVIKTKEAEKPPTYFETVAEFGQYFLEKSGRNSSIELEEQTTKLGGNMPIMANALARYGCDVSSLGAMGYPKLHPVFEAMAGTCKCHSFAAPGLSSALEFSDGKIMLGQMKTLQELDWELIKSRLGSEVIIELFHNSDLIAALNWSELDQSSAIWRGLLTEVLPHCVREQRPIGFFDLSDCSKRSESALLEMLELLTAFAEYWQVVLSLNLNEAETLYKIVASQSAANAGLSKIGEVLFEHLNIQNLVIHHALEAMSWSSKGYCIQKANFVEKPKIVTGAGDHFNAGYCLALLLDLDDSNALLLGHATAYYYLNTGLSPDFQGLKNTIKTFQA